MTVSGDTLTYDAFYTLCLRAGRVHGPKVLLDSWMQGRIDNAILSNSVAEVWSAAEYPEQALRRCDWRNLFYSAGYTVDGQLAERPTEPIRLYRGSIPQRRCGWSWTGDLDIAQRFAAGYETGGPIGRLAGEVWEIMAPPAALLSHITGRQEDEYVVDTRGLRIVRYQVSTEDGAA